MTNATEWILSLATQDLSPEQKTTHFLEELQERIDIIRHKLKFIEKKPTIACISNLVSLSLAEGVVSQLIAVAGGIPILENQTKIDWDDIRLADPEIIVLMLEGLSVEQAMRSVNTLLSQNGFEQLLAVKHNRFYIADGNKHFYRSGPAVVDSLEILAEIINPKQFIFGYEGSAWVKFEI